MSFRALAGTSAFGVVHKTLGDEDPAMPVPVKRTPTPGKFDASAIRRKLAPIKAEAVKAATKTR